MNIHCGIMMAIEEAAENSLGHNDFRLFSLSKRRGGCVGGKYVARTNCADCQSAIARRTKWPRHAKRLRRQTDSFSPLEPTRHDKPLQPLSVLTEFRDTIDLVSKPMDIHTLAASRQVVICIGFAYNDRLGCAADAASDDFAASPKELRRER